MRLFIAIEMPHAWRVAAASVVERLAARSPIKLRVSAAQNTHLTVRFLGEVEEDDLPALIAALEQVRATPCELRLGAAGTFGPATRTRVVWLGVTGDSQCLVALIGAVDRALESVGLVGETKQWRPHLTLARVGHRATTAQRRALAESVVTLPVPRGEPFLANTISLYRSHLGDGPPRYELLTSVRIG